MKALLGHLGALGAIAILAGGCIAPQDDTSEPSDTSEQGLTSALPEGPVNLHLEGYAHDFSGTRGKTIKITCDLTGTNPGPINTSCSANAIYDGMAFAAQGTGNGDGASVTYRYDATDTRGTRRTRRGYVGIAFLRKGDTLWARMSASYDAQSGFTRQSFGTSVPALVVVTPGTAKPNEIQSTERTTCDAVCRNAGQRCLMASAATSRWVAFEGCPALGQVPSTMASCGTSYSPRSGFSGEVCNFRLHCQCI